MKSDDQKLSPAVRELENTASVNAFEDLIQNRYVGIRGFLPANIWRMRQFYETYNGNEKLATLLRELTW
ncbi:hypothetical protein AGMMS49975_21250 [Clostridia bacterium]|nr:hypothetical protein AGMMS49975_21250 [Clostridia bacterium]